MAKKQAPWMNSLFRKNNVRQAIKNIVEDVRYNIQYNHAPKENPDPETVRRVINSCIVNGHVGSRYITNMIEGRIDDLKLLKTMLNIKGSQLSIKFDGRMYRPGSIRPGLTDRTLKTVENKISNAESMLDTCLPRTVLVVPKNSDKSSSAYRKFITKPYLNEVIIGAVCHSLNKESMILESVREGRAEAQFFGAGMVSSNTYPEQQHFRHYITEYESFLNCVDSLPDYGYMMYFDISKFFDSIRIETLVDMLVSNIRYNYNPALKSRLKQFLIGCFYFDMKDIRSGEEVSQYRSGLTIETHYQHLLANLYIREIMKEVVGEIDQMTQSCQVINYIDDFYIRSNNAAEVAAIFEVIKRVFASYGLSIADNKTSEVMEVAVVKQNIKKLVRLPASSYFEMINRVMAIQTAEDADSEDFSPYESLAASTGMHAEDLARVRDSDGAEEWHNLFTNKTDLTALQKSIRSGIITKHGLAKCLEGIPAGVGHRMMRIGLDEYITNHGVDRADVPPVLYSLASSESYYAHVMKKGNLEAELEASRKRGQSRSNRYYASMSSGSLKMKAAKARLYINDLQYWINNRENYLMATDPDDYLQKLHGMIEGLALKDDPEHGILEVLQQFYLTELDGNEENTELFVKMLDALREIVVTKYPAKISFVAGVIRRFWSHMPERYAYRIMPYKADETERCFKVLSESTNEQEINEAYLAYRFYRYPIIP